jgi:RNA polymerase sigma-70 factor (ECF subfamily)
VGVTDARRALLDRLEQGDVTAIEEIFRAYEPLLRRRIRRRLTARLRSKIDSADIAQSVWCELLLGFRQRRWRFPTAAHLRAFLVQAAYRRLIDQSRRQQDALRHEQNLAPEDLDALPPRYQEGVGARIEAEELWRRLWQCCPPQHRQLLHLRREGSSLAEIAERSGLHPSSVRRIFYDLASRLTKVAE